MLRLLAWPLVRVGIECGLCSDGCQPRRLRGRSPRSKCRVVRPAARLFRAGTVTAWSWAASGSWHSSPRRSKRPRHGSAGSVVVRGEPGIGKTALLDELVRLTAAATILRTRGLEVEAPLAYAALHRLLRPLTRLRSQLPPPQARALRMAFGEEDGPAVEPFLIGVATLTVLTAAAEEQLVLCVVDDAHWLDPATADALLFCARRIGADRVAMMFATRDGAADRFEAQDLAEITLTGLTPDAAQALLDTHVGTTRAEEVTHRLISETRGNPLALLELPTELSAAQLHGASPLPVQLHLTARLERVFLERSRSQPGEVQSFLLLAAADDTGDLAVLKAAAAEPGPDRAGVGSGGELRAAGGRHERRRCRPAASTGALGDLPGGHQ